MSSMQPEYDLPIPVVRALRKLGSDIRNARKRRRLTMALVSERASISRATLSKLEKGDPGVSIGIFASVLHAIGLLNNLEEAADLSKDPLGRMLDEENLPERVRYSSKTEHGE